MSSVSDQNDINLGLEGLIVSLVITIVTVVVCLVCTVIICLVRCSSSDDSDREYFLGSMLRRTLGRYQRDVVSRAEQQADEEEENATTRVFDLAESPPPAYRNVSQFQNVDMEHAEVVRLRSMYRLSSHMESGTLSLPPDYISTQGEDETTERLSSSVAPQEMQVEGGQLPPTYSTAQMELMARRTASVEEYLPSELATDVENHEQDRSTATEESHLPSNTQEEN